MRVMLLADVAPLVPSRFRLMVWLYGFVLLLLLLLSKVSSSSSSLCRGRSAKDSLPFDIFLLDEEGRIGWGGGAVQLFSLYDVMSVLGVWCNNKRLRKVVS